MKANAATLGLGLLDPSATRVPGGPKSGDAEAIQDAARQFESVFLHQVFKSMRASLPEDGWLSGGFGGQVFTDMLDQQYAEQASATGSLGLATLIANDLGASDQPAGSAPAAHRHAVGMRAYGASARSSQSWAMPVEGRLSSPFGMRQLADDEHARMHDGMDIAAAHGAPIHAARGGVVEFAGVRGGYGNTVVLDHGDGTKSLYAHASELLVREGERVRKGAEIAQVGSTGHSTGPHLHFEVRRDGEPVDPASLLRAQQ